MANKKWTSKHTIPLRVYEAYCQVCGLWYQLEAQGRPDETYCSFCENTEPIKVTEVKPRGGKKNVGV